MKEIKKIGIVAMPRISTGGGFQRVARDLIALFNSMGKSVHLLTPFPVNLQKISELYGPIKIDKYHYPNSLIAYFAREPTLGRKLMVRHFQDMAQEVDFIVDLDGEIFHKYLPKNFDKNNYVVWRLSCINPETHKLQKFTNFKILAKKIVKSAVTKKNDIPHDVRIYPLDEWTKKEIIEFWKVKPQDLCLYPEIKVEEMNPSSKKLNQIVILGRIAPNKEIHTSMKIFAAGAKDFQNYNLVILGGSTPDTEKYVEELNSLADELKIKDKTKIKTDPTFEEIKETLAKSKIILDSQIGTSLNMPVIEAMASGCVAIMRKYSGTFTEILGGGKYGYGFDNIEEGARILSELLSKKNLDNKKSLSRAQFFSSASFKKRVNSVLQNK